MHEDKINDDSICTLKCLPGATDAYNIMIEAEEYTSTSNNLIQIPNLISNFTTEQVLIDYETDGKNKRKNKNRKEKNTNKKRNSNHHRLNEIHSSAMRHCEETCNGQSSKICTDLAQIESFNSLSNRHIESYIKKPSPNMMPILDVTANWPPPYAMI